MEHDARSAPPGTATVAASVRATFAVLAIGVLVFLWAGQGQGLGPLDLETADRVALALWVGAPIVGGLVGRRSTNRGLIRAALAIGLALGLIVGLFPSSGTGDYTCWLTLPSVTAGYLIGRLVVGLLVGIGMAFALLVTGLSTRRLATAVPGVLLAGLVNLVASTAAYELFYGGVRCLS